MDQEFSGKVAIVTGAGAGIGEATAKMFAQRGGAVVVAEINEGEGQRVADEINQVGGIASFFSVDVANAARLEEMIAHAVATFGRVDLLHNNALYSAIGVLDKLELDGWNKTVAVNLTAPWLASKFAIPHMKKQGSGVIVNMASVGALGADRGLGAYGATKAGLTSLTRTIAVEYGAFGIRSVCICPGTIYTTPLKSVLGELDCAPPSLEMQKFRDEFKKNLLATNTLGRFGLPQEIAEAVLFIASSRAAYMTGTTITIDGGLTSKTGLPQLVEA